MELSANELSIYDKLSETIDLVRQTGHQCGMSEKAIEKFIKQLLERNEPQRGPPRYPVLVALYKVRWLLCMNTAFEGQGSPLHLSFLFPFAFS